MFYDSCNAEYEGIYFFQQQYGSNPISHHACIEYVMSYDSIERVLTAYQVVIGALILAGSTVTRIENSQVLNEFPLACSIINRICHPQIALVRTFEITQPLVKHQ